MTTNLLSSFLCLLGVKHTSSFSSQYFAEHPHKYNLFGLSSMLYDYKVNNIGIKVSDKNDINRIETPFIAHTGSDFAIVEKIDNNLIHFTEGGKKIKATIDEFLEMWTGYILIAEVDAESIEPNYKVNFQKELFHNISKISALVISAFLIILGIIYNNSYKSLAVIFLLLISLVGVYICYLLILKQLRVHSNYADKLCSLFKYNDCNNILDSEAAKLFGVVGWSEIGFGYFITNVIIVSSIPSIIPSLLLINIFSLPYTVWSIWFQKVKVKQWCPLCLITMLSLWAIFIVGIFAGLFNLYLVTLLGLFISCSLYAVSILVINLLIPIIAQSSQMKNIKYEINSLKADEDVFKALLRKQQHFEVSKDNSQILFGNVDSNTLITVFSNPHCSPCSSMHVRLNNLLDKNKDICIQYIFSSFNEELEISNKYLIGAYLQKYGDAKSIYDNWFEEGKINKDEFFRLNPINLNYPRVNEEFKLHEQWKKKSGLRATPTVLVNGYKLPDNFKIEDIKYITNL